MCQRKWTMDSQVVLVKVINKMTKGNRGDDIDSVSSIFNFNDTNINIESWILGRFSANWSASH